MHSIDLYLYHGYDLFPLQGKKPPPGWMWRTERPLDETHIKEYVSNKYNLGVRLGPNDLIIDVDPRNGGDVSFEKLKRDLNINLGQYPVVETGGGGLHIYCRMQGPRDLKVKLDRYPGIDLLSEGRYIVAAGSIHPDTGKEYKWLQEPSWIEDVPPAPDVLVTCYTKPLKNRDVVLPKDGDADEQKIQRALAKAIKAIESAPGGARNETLNKAAYTFAGECAYEGADARVYEDELAQAALNVGLSQTEIDATLASALRSGDERPLQSGQARSLEEGLDLLEGHQLKDVDTIKNKYERRRRQAEEILRLQKAGMFIRETDGGYTMDDYGNVERFVLINKDVAGYSSSLGWVCWDGKRWATNEQGAALAALSHETIQVMYVEAELLGEQGLDDMQKAMKKHIRRTRGASGYGFLEKGARSHMPLVIDQFDKKGMLLNVANGTVNLATGKLQPHRKEDMLTKIAPMSYDPDAELKGSRWEQFLEEVFPDVELRAFMQILMGYCITGEIDEKIITVFHGDGNNGKSTFLNMINFVLGIEFYTVAPNELFVQRPNKNMENIKASLMGARLAVNSETNARDKLDEGLLKSLTGNDHQIRARLLYKEPFSFPLTAKLILQTNHRPNVSGMDQALWERICMIPFNQTFEGAAKDKHLEKKLQAEAQVVLKWLVDGASMWRLSGLHKPEIVKACVAEYRFENNPVERWFAECMEVKPGAEEASKDLYESFCSWSLEQGEKPMNNRRFGMDLGRIESLEKHKDSKKGRTWRGARLTTQPHERNALTKLLK